MEIRKMKWLAYLIVPFIAVAISCKDDDDDMGNGNGSDHVNGPNEVVLEDFTQDNLAIIELGTQAVSGGEDTLIRAFGQMMINAYSSAQDFLEAIAEGRNVDLPAEPGNEQQQFSDSLGTLTGPEFDSVYIFNQILMHTETKNYFEAVFDTTNDQALKNYINQYLPAVTSHLQLADSIAALLFNYEGGGIGNDTTGIGNDTTGVGNDTTGVGNDTTGVGNDTTGVGNDTTGVGNDTTGMGNDTTGVGVDTTGVGNGGPDGGMDGGSDGGTDGGTDGGNGGAGDGDGYGIRPKGGTGVV